MLLAHNAITLQLLGWGMVGAYRLPIRVRPLDEVPVFAARLLLEFPKQTLGGLSVKLGRWLGHEGRIRRAGILNKIYRRAGRDRYSRQM